MKDSTEPSDAIPTLQEKEGRTDSGKTKSVHAHWDGAIWLGISAVTYGLGDLG